MADIKLGPSGSQTTLPAVRWPSGAAPELPADFDGLADEVRMLDGSVRFNILDSPPATWTLEWNGIVWSEVQTIIGVAALGQKLVYTNEYTDGANHNVVVTRYSYALKAETASRTPRYVVTLALKEATG